LFTSTKPALSTSVACAVLFSEAFDLALTASFTAEPFPPIASTERCVTF
jgi:hypothetical protein